MPSRSALMAIGASDQRLLGTVEILHELDQAAVIEQFLGLDVGMALVGQARCARRN
jgi:hypothetical protein